VVDGHQIEFQLVLVLFQEFPIPIQLDQLDFQAATSSIEHQKLGLDRLALMVLHRLECTSDSDYRLEGSARPFQFQRNLR
jgi:hypothetical protein